MSWKCPLFFSPLFKKLSVVNCNYSLNAFFSYWLWVYPCDCFTQWGNSMHWYKQSLDKCSHFIPCSLGMVPSLCEAAWDRREFCLSQPFHLPQWKPWTFVWHQIRPASHNWALRPNKWTQAKPGELPIQSTLNIS